MEWDIALFYALKAVAEQSGLVDRVMLGIARPANIFVPVVLACGYWVGQNRREAFIGAPTLAFVVAVGDFLGAQVYHAATSPLVVESIETDSGVGAGTA